MARSIVLPANDGGAWVVRATDGERAELATGRCLEDVDGAWLLGRWGCRGVDLAWDELDVLERALFDRAAFLKDWRRLRLEPPRWEEEWCDLFE